MSIVLVAALNTLGAAKLGQLKACERARGHLLAQELLSEIMQQSYADPESVGRLDLARSIGDFPPGPEADEGTTDRSDFDDVDDYEGWSASPPENKDGSEIAYLEGEGWTRSVTMKWLKPDDPPKESDKERGLKRVTVTVTHNGVQVAGLVAWKGAGLPAAPTAPRVLLVVTKASDLTAQESARRTLMESWGFTVSLIETDDAQTDFDEAAEEVDVVYVSEQIDDAELGTKLRDALIGVVNEEAGLADEFGFVQLMAYDVRDEVRIVDDSHYITPPFDTGALTLFSSTQPVHWLTSLPAPDLQTLAETLRTGSTYKPSLATLESGAILWDGGTAVGRRVELPWGDVGFDISALNADGQTIMKRAIEWAANME